MKIKKNLIYGLVVSLVISLSTFGVVNAATNNSNNSLKQQLIPNKILRSTRLMATSQVLNISTKQVKQAYKSKSLSKLIIDAGFTIKTYRTKLHSQLSSDFKKEGYSLDQVIISNEHHTIIKLRKQLISGTSTKNG